MMYSSGLPILYLIAVVTFFAQYWFDKLFCNLSFFLIFKVLKCYSKTPQINLDLSKATRALMKFSLILHFLIGLYMYSNSSILSSNLINEEVLDYLDSDNRYFNKERFSNLHIIIFLSALCLIFLVILFRLTIVKMLRCCIKCCRRKGQKHLFG